MQERQVLVSELPAPCSRFHLPIRADYVAALPDGRVIFSQQGAAIPWI